MFKLLNGKKIDEEKMIIAMEDNDISNLYFLDTKTGNVESDLDQSDSTRYIKIPKIRDSQVHEWIHEYTDEFIHHEDPEFAKKVYMVLKSKRPIKKIEDVLEQSKEGWIHGWTQWKRDCIYEEMKEWFLSLPINITEEFEWFDDCSICQKMKKAEEENRNLSIAELKETFANF